MYQTPTLDHAPLLEHLAQIDPTAAKRHALWACNQIKHLAGTSEDVANYETLLSELNAIASLPIHEQTPAANATWCVTWGAEWGRNRAVARQRRLRQSWPAPLVDHQTLQACWDAIDKAAKLFDRPAPLRLVARIDELVAVCAVSVSLDAGDTDVGCYLLDRCCEHLRKSIWKFSNNSQD